MSIPEHNDMNGDDRQRKGNRKTKILLASLALLALLSLFVFLGNPGLLVPDRDDGQAEATDNSGSGSNESDQSDNSNDSSGFVNQVPVVSNQTNSGSNDNNNQPKSGGNGGGFITILPGEEETPCFCGGGGGGGGHHNNGDQKDNNDNDNVNHAPVAENGHLATNEDVAVSFKMNGTDQDGNNLTFAIVSGPSHGAMSAFDSSTGQSTYTPTANYSGVDMLGFKVNDGSANSGMANITITINAMNDAPTAANVSGIITDEDMPVVVNMSSAISDADGDSLTISITESPIHGDAIINENGTITYSPNANFNGEDEFRYRASDGSLFSNNATISVTVNPANDAPMAMNFTISTMEDTPMEITVINATSDVDGDVTNLIIVDLPSNGLISISEDNKTIIYTPNQDFNGVDSFTYKLSDGVFESGIGLVSIEVTAVNDAPTISPGVFDNITLSEDSSVIINIVGGVIDAEDDIITITNVTQPGNGTVVINEDGTVTYTPNPNFNGHDSFDFTVSDGNGGSVTGTVTVIVNQVNDAPISSSDVYSTDEDTALNVDAASGMLANDTDADQGDSIIAILVDDVNDGILSLNSDGSFSYTPNNNFYGSDSFTYQAEDQSGSQSAIETVTINVNSVNDAPTANDDHKLVDKVDPNVLSVLDNDFDIEGDMLSIDSATQPSFGNVTINNDNTITYTAGSEFNDTDSFEYTVIDENGGTATAEVIVFDNGVNHAPSASDMNLSTDEDTTLFTSLSGSDIDGNEIHFVQTSQASHGQATVEDDGTLTYVPNPNYFGLDSFTFQVNDGIVDSGIATVTITVTNVNDAPTANDNNYSMTEDETSQITSEQGVLVNDNDIDGDSLSAVIVNAPSHGNLTLNADGSFTYMPEQNYNGADSFTYMANDGELDSNVAEVSIAITAVNDGPVANDDSAFTTLEAPVLIHVLDNDTDVEGDAIHIIGKGSASDGTVAITGNQQAVVYTPNTGFTGYDEFTYTISDGNQTSTATVTVYVYPASFGHLQPPVGGSGNHEFEQGNTAAVRFKLFDENGAQISDATVLLRIQQLDNNNNPIGAVQDATSAGGANDGPYFRYSSSFYHYDLKTDGMALGKWALYVYLVDPIHGEILMEDAPIDGISSTIIVK